MSRPHRVAILGGGISGLTAAYEIARRAAGGTAIEATLFEASNRLGGIVETVREGGFTIECGPDAWVTAKPWARDLAIEVGLESDLIPSLDEHRKTLILQGEELVPLPPGMTMMVPADLNALAESALFTDPAKRAYQAEITRASELRAASPEHDESVAAFVLRHFGQEVLDRVAGPLLTGIFGGDVQRLSVRAAMPRFVAMERQHGSLISALQHEAFLQKHPAPVFTTLNRGLDTLLHSMLAAIPPAWIRLRTEVMAIERPPGDPQWQVRSKPADGMQSFDTLFLATPVPVSRRLLQPIDAQISNLLPHESSSAVLVAFCFDDAAQFPVPPGFGFLVPNGSTIGGSLLRMIACTFADQKFPGRVPTSGRLVRAFFGGAAAQRLATCGNDEIASIARSELARILHRTSGPTLPAKPVLTIVRRWMESLPQYGVGHLDCVAEIEAKLRKLSGLHLLGNGMHGVGLPDLIRDARATARSLVPENK